MTRHFIWYELLTSDPDAAAAFYGAVIGWTASDSHQVPTGDWIVQAHDPQDAVFALLGPRI